MSISEPFIRRPVATALLTVGLLLGGLAGYRELPVSALPQVEYPTIVVSTSNGLFGSDNTLADLAGNDGVPELAVGRVPASSAGELQGYVDKIKAYEADNGSWARDVVALADNADQSADFAGDR